MISKQETTLQEEMLSQFHDKSLFEQTKAYAYEYMDGIFDRNIFPTDEAIEKCKGLDGPLPEAPENPKEILSLLHRLGSPATVNQLGGRYFGFVNGSSVPAALAAKWLSDVWDQNAAISTSSPVISQIETICEKWVVELLGLPLQTAAGFVSGSSIAVLCGIAAGRNELLKRQGWDVNSDGLFGALPIRVILGEQAHSTIFKALGLLGLGRSRVEMVPVDTQGRMIASKMPKVDCHCLVIAQAGNVNTGAFDPFIEICNAARSAEAWVHIDGAFGLWAAVSENRNKLTRGIELADSWSVDAHKTLNAPYDSGIILCQDRNALISTLQISSAYIHQSEKRDNMHYTPEMSRRARAVELWATLKALGKSGVAELVDRLCSHAEGFARLLKAEGFQILNNVVFNQVLVCCDTPELTQKTLEIVQKSGECWCGSTLWNGKPAIRISVCSWATTTSDVDRSVAAFVKARNSLTVSAKTE
ncbi:MAG: pyridoxal-dependent decarboxylase [Chloroflexi bacterium]|nr:pyridoxal-dependent decarboxylase [Chloroflexota bacterium]